MDKDLSDFATDDAAYYYAKENGACVSENGDCVFCGRADH